MHSLLLSILKKRELQCVNYHQRKVYFCEKKNLLFRRRKKTEKYEDAQEIFKKFFEHRLRLLKKNFQLLFLNMCLSLTESLHYKCFEKLI